MMMLALMLNTVFARAEFPSTFPPRKVSEINAIIETYERGEVPHYRTGFSTHFDTDEVLAYGSASGLAAGLQYHAKYFSTEARRALVLGLGRLAAAALHLGALEGQFNSDDIDARGHLGYLFAEDFPDLHAIRLLQQIARGKKLKAHAAEAQEALKMIYTKADAIISRRGTFKDSKRYKDDDIEMILEWMFLIDEATALKDLRRYAERGHYTGAAQYFIVNRLAARDPTRMWQTCHEALLAAAEPKKPKQ